MEKKSKVQVSTVIKIPEGKLEEFKQQAAKLIKLVREKDTGTLKHDWFISSDQTECEIREEYKSPEALLEHIVNYGGTLTKFFKEFPLDHLKGYGDPEAAPPQLLEMIKGLNVKMYSFLQGLEEG